MLHICSCFFQTRNKWEEQACSPGSASVTQKNRRLLCTRPRHDWNSAALAALANLGRPKLLFIVQSNGQFQINVIAKLPTASLEVFLSADYGSKTKKIATKLVCKSSVLFYEKTRKVWFTEGKWLLHGFYHLCFLSWLISSLNETKYFPQWQHIKNKLGFVI